MSKSPFHLMQFLITTFLAGAVLAAAGEPGEFRGPMPEKQQDLIRLLATNHGKLQRKVEQTSDGYRARTTTDDPELAAALKEHLAYMQRRLNAGAGVRNWDPAFRELKAHHQAIRTRVRELENGVEVEVHGFDPMAVLVARNHARVVTGFVSEGPAAVRRKHPTVAQD